MPSHTELWTVLSSFLSVIHSHPYTGLSFAFTVHYFCHQKYSQAVLIKKKNIVILYPIVNISIVKYSAATLFSCKRTSQNRKNGPCLNGVSWKPLRYSRVLWEKKTNPVKSIQTWLDMCTQKQQTELTPHIRSSAETNCKLLYVASCEFCSILLINLNVIQEITVSNSDFQGKHCLMSLIFM